MIDTKDLQNVNVPDHICLLCGYQVICKFVGYHDIKVLCHNFYV